MPLKEAVQKAISHMAEKHRAKAKKKKKKEEPGEVEESGELSKDETNEEDQEIPKKGKGKY